MELTKKDVDRFWSKVVRGPGCWLLVGRARTDSQPKAGYGDFWLKGRSERAHRVSWSMHFGVIPDGLFVLHRCDNPRCVRPEHLFLGTQKDNVRDMINKGRARHATGEKSGAYTHPEKLKRGVDVNTAKLMPHEVLEIRRAYNPNAKCGPYTKKGLAKRFGVCRPNITAILERQTWRHL